MLHSSIFISHKIACKIILTPKKIGSRWKREYVCKDCRILKTSVPKHNRGQYHERQSNNGYPRRHRLPVAHRKVQAILAMQRHRTTLNFAIGLNLAIGWRRTNDRLLEMMTEIRRCRQLGYFQCFFVAIYVVKIPSKESARTCL